MADLVRIARLLRSVTDDVAFLGSEADAGEQRRVDPAWLRGVKYAFVTAVEACVDVAHHLCATQGWGPPSDNGNAMAVLARHGVLEPDLAERMRRAVGFRNVLVHEYVAVDDRIVLARLQDLSDLQDFVRCVTGWIAR